MLVTYVRITPSLLYILDINVTLTLLNETSKTFIASLSHVSGVTLTSLKLHSATTLQSTPSLTF